MYTIDHAAVWGGAMYTIDHAVIATANCTMTYNTASEGGVINAGEASMVTILEGNVPFNLAYSEGGVVVLATYSAVVTATQSTMASNFANYDGAVLSTRGVSTALVTHCTISSNSVYSSGGAVFVVENSAVMLTNCSMTSNSASFGAAVLAEGDSTFTATDCTISSNVAAEVGGAIKIDGHSIVTATGCAMTFNTASNGGGGAVYVGNRLCSGHDDGVCHGSVRLTLTGCDLSSNRAADQVFAQNMCCNNRCVPASVGTCERHSGRCVVLGPRRTAKRHAHFWLPTWGKRRSGGCPSLHSYAYSKTNPKTLKSYVLPSLEGQSQCERTLVTFTSRNRNLSQIMHRCARLHCTALHHCDIHD